MTSEKMDHQITARRSALASIVVGLACLSAGVYGVVDSWWFGVNSKPAVATVVEIDHSAEIDTLEFTVDGKSFRVQARGAFGLGWGPSLGMRARVPILYVVNDPNNARLAHFSARFTMPLILLVLGLMFAPAGWMLRGDSKWLSNEELERFMDPFRNC